MSPSLTRSMASLLAVPALLPWLAAANPYPTAPAVFDKRANGANTIGFSLSGSSWRTRSCNTGYFSTSGGLGNCCVNNSCNFLTSCVGSTIYYANGDSSTCASSTCGAGTVFKTPGDQSPLTMYNCQSDWTATETPSPTADNGSATDSSTKTPTTRDSSTATQTSPSATGGATTSNISAQDTATSSPSAGSTPTSGSTVVMTVTNSDGSVSTSTSVAAVPQASGSASPETTTTDNGNSGGGSNAGAIAGGVVGGLAVLAILAGVIFFLVWKRKKASKEAAAGTTAPLNPDGSAPSGPLMGENAQWNAQSTTPGYGGPVPTYGHAQGSYAPHQQQDYKMPLSGGGYAVAPQGPQQLDGTPVQANRPSELYGGNVQGPVEMPAQGGYSR